ncbi:transcription factor HIVEP2 [Pseudophryne corroboree]|uniref:transcription factor HIVEP2 n=1 Tax=Pseudophryne corroboree TaxID=495146 RepID=UPI003081A413
MDSGDTVLGQESTSRCGESDKVSGRWRQENPAIVTMSTFQEGERQPQVNPEQNTNPASGQHYSSLKAGSQSETTPQMPEKQYTQKRSGSYTHRHSLSFPQHTLHPQRLVHSMKPHQSLEGQAYPYHSHMTVPSEDLFFRMHGHSATFSRKKFSALASSYSQYSQKSIEHTEDTYKKEQKPKKPGKYICPYCTRACAKPSVLKKHIRSHTGERPYPCVPCGFSFKTKSNLYKHRKSHAHAIKAGLVPFTDSSVSKLDLEASCIDVETEIHSDGEQSTDTDEETLLLVEDSEKLSPISQIPVDIGVRCGEYLDPAFHTSEESLGGPIKVPILIVPKSGIHLPSESSHYVASDLMHSPSISGKSDEPHTARQKLALKLSEKKGHDSEKSLNLLSPHSKGSTDSGYFSRSESAEQNISPPNTNATSYEEIIFGKYCRLSPRSSLQSQEANISIVNASMIEEHISQFMTKREGFLDHSKLKSIKTRLSGIHSSELQKTHLIAESAESDSKVYPEMQHGQTAVLIDASGDTSPLIRSNSMPTSSGASLSIPPSIRGSHSFDECMTGSDDVFYPGTTGIPHQRLLRRQGAFELPLVLEGHSDLDAYTRMSKNAAAAYCRKTIHETSFSSKEKKISSVYDYHVSGMHPKRWDEHEPHIQGHRDRQYIGGMKPGAEYFIDVTAPSPPRFGTMIENRKRRKEKSVGDEEDVSMPCSAMSSSAGSPVILDFDSKSQSQESPRVGFSIGGQEYVYSGPLDRFDICRSHQQMDSPVPVLDESSSDTDKLTDIINRKPPGNVISVIQHTNSLSRPNSFERSESTELLTGQPDKACSPSETCDSGNTMSSMSPDWTQTPDIIESTGRPSASQHSQQSTYHMPPKLVRQHNITVPEIRVTEEPDKPEKEPEIPVKEPEKPPEEFQWPQRSETLSQLPAEKLPPKKKRLRLADMENSSGESSFESTGTSLSRSPSQESNLSHSSSFSMSFEREEIMKSIVPTKQDEIGRPPEFLTVPPGAYSLSVPSQHHQKEMRRSSSEQIPCPNLTEIPEIRSKSFDYGNLTHASVPGAITTTLSPARERKKCFLVRQASFSGFPENSQTEQELGNQEQSDQVYNSRRSSQIAWQHSPSSSMSGSTNLPDEAGNVAVGTSAQPTCTSSHYSQQSYTSHDALRNPVGHQSSYIPKRHLPEQQHSFPHPEQILYPPVHNTFHLPYTSVCMAQMPAHHPLLWPSCIDPLQRHFQHHLQNTYFKPSTSSELHSSYYLDTAEDPSACKPLNYLHNVEKGYQPYLETSSSSSKKSKNLLSKLQRDHSGGSSDSSSDQQLSISPSVGSLQALAGPVVPVRIQTHVPSYGSVMYTSISQILVTHSQTHSPSIVICKVDGSTSQRIMATNASMRGLGFNIAHMLGPCGDLEQYPLWKVPRTLPLDLDSAIPLCLVSTSDSASPFGGGKRVLSPASSLELFMETKQQKRVKEEKMYGQIVKELSAVELTNSDIKKDLSRTSKPQLVRQGRTTEQKDVLTSVTQTLSPSLSNSPLSTSSCVETSLAESKSSDAPEGRMSPDEFYNEDTASDMSLSPQRTSSEILDDEPLPGKILSVGILMQMSERSCADEGASRILIKDRSEIQLVPQFPSLRTTTTVSWCFLNYAKPSHTEQESLKSSVYAAWCISSGNPNPAGLSTRTSLALLKSKQKNALEIYTMAAMHRSGAGKLTSSSVWKLQFAKMKPEPSLLVSSKLEKKTAGSSKERTKGESHGEKDISTKQTEPIRIKIFEGGFKSNEDYVYVRGRGRGKYICEECGIRCKKPSMLKKHIRTHTDVRPYVCKLCNFAFKTKGNLTKHMKSKAHMKKCLELGVAMTSVDDAEAEESGNIDDAHKESEKSSIAIDHQFSDAEETDGDDGDDNDEDDDEEEDFDDNQGDTTPKTRSRSTSPQPPRFSTLSVTAASASHRASPEGSMGHSSLMSYLSTMPSIQVTHLVAPSVMCGDSKRLDYQKLFLNSLEHDRDKMDVPGSMDDDFMLTSEPSSSPRDFSSCSRHSSPGYDSSPCRDNSPKRYLSLRGDLSPRRHLSPRRDASPMRHLSPRKEAALRRELSPRRDVSPRRHLSPLRPMSPGKDITTGRDLSPRRERRYMATFRALSPRRRLHHNPSLPMSHYLHSDSGLLGHGSSRKNWPQFPYVGPPSEDFPGHQSLGQAPDGHKDYVFSHLPLHSQQQTRAPLPMIPIGGIQIINSNTAIQPSHSTTTPVHPSSSDEKTIPSVESCIPLHLKKHSDFPLGDPLPGGIPTLLPSPGQSPSDESSKPTEREEENIRTCTKAIACLRIAAEEGLLLKQDQLSRPPEPNQKTLESAQFGIRHFSGLEAGMSLACASPTHVDLHREKDSFGTSQSTLAHSKFYSKSMDMTKLGFHGRKEESTSTQEIKDSSTESSNLH